MKRSASVRPRLRKAIFSFPRCSRPRERLAPRRFIPATDFSARMQVSPRPARPHGIVFIGPTPQQMRDFGLKHTAREIAAENGVPMLPGSGLLSRRQRRTQSGIRRRLSQRC